MTQLRLLRLHWVPMLCVACYYLLRTWRTSSRLLVLQTRILMRRFNPDSKFLTAVEANSLLTSIVLLPKRSLAAMSLVWILSPLMRDGVISCAQSLNPDGRSLRVTITLHYIVT